MVSQPDRGHGRGRRSRPSPVSACAQERGWPLLRPDEVGDSAAIEALREHTPDLGVVVAYGQFLPRKVRELPREGYLLNAHASLLPRFRGAAPIARAVLEGETTTGISVMRIEREMDAGPVALVRELTIGPEETTGELEGRLSLVAADAIDAALQQVAEGTLQWRDQDPAQATVAPRLAREEARLNWQEDADALVRRVRAFAPKPGATTTLGGDTLRILAARAVEDPTDRRPGRILLDPAQREQPLRIATGRGWLVPLELQRAGGRVLPVADFLRGRPIDAASEFG